MRQLGIPTVIDRLIQQALHQVLQPVFDSGFSESSYGFRPGRSAHDAVRRAQLYVKAGRRWVVGIDLEKFFDRIERLKNKLRALFRQGRGRNLNRFVETLTPILRGWVNYFRLAECKGIFEELDGWIRLKLRCVR